MELVFIQINAKNDVNISQQRRHQSYLQINVALTKITQTCRQRLAYPKGTNEKIRNELNPAQYIKRKAEKEEIDFQDQRA
jgi:hypothetical protein